MSLPLIRVECPPGLCVCGRAALLADPQADARVLRLTQLEEKKLIARIDNVASYEELKRISERMDALLGVVLHIIPSIHGVRTVRGFSIRLEERPGLCRKTRLSIPAAVRRCLRGHPEIAHAILNSMDLLSEFSPSEMLDILDQDVSEPLHGIEAGPGIVGREDEVRLTE